MLGAVVLFAAFVPGGAGSIVARPLASSEPIATARPMPTEAAALTGRLLGPEGVGLAGHVAAWRESDPNGPRLEADCAADGGFTLPGLAEDRWVVSATAPGFSEARAVRAFPLTAPLDLRVVRTARVAGQVLGVDGQPAVAEVLIVGSAIWPARTVHADASGQFAFESVPPGVYEVEARGALASAEPRRGLVVEEGARIVLTLALSPGRTLRGTVVDDATGAPIANAEIVVAESALSSTPRVTRSDATGAFQISGLRDGVDAIVTARSEGRVSLVAQPWRGTDLTLRLRPTGIVEGFVLDQDRRPIEGAQIEVWGQSADGQPIAVSEGTASFASRLFDGAPSDPSRLEVMADVPPIPIEALSVSASLPADMPDAVHLASYRTGADGSFHLDGVAPGVVEVLARRTGFATGSSSNVRVRGGETTSGVEVVLAPAGTLAGVVVDERGDGVGDVRIEARSERDPWPTIVFTDATGRFEIAATGDTVVRAVPMDRAPSEARLAVASGARQDTTLTLDPAGLTLSGRVLDDRGFPIESAQLRIEALRPGTPILRTAFSAQDGTFELSAVPSPPLRITVDHGSFATGTSVDVGTLEDHDIRLEPGLDATGAVSDAWSGEPIAGARVLLVSSELPPVFRETTVREDGGFSVPRLRAGTYTMRIEAPGYVAATQTLAVHPSRRGEVEIPAVALDPGQRVEGDVVDHFGSVVEGALVRVDGGAPVLTDAHGHFAIACVPAGDVTVSVSQESAGAVEIARHVVRGRDDVSIVAHLPGRLDASPTASLPLVSRGIAITLDGSVVSAVAPGSSAERAGIRVGDTLVAVDGQPGAARLSGSGTALLTLTREGTTYLVRADRERR